MHKTTRKLSLLCNYCSKLLSKYSVVFLFLKNAIDILNHHPPAYKDNIHRVHWFAQFTVQSLYAYCTLMLTYSWQHTSILKLVQPQFKLSPLYRLTGSQNTSIQSLLIIGHLYLADHGSTDCGSTDHVDLLFQDCTTHIVNFCL